jgi:hypothetical protein
VCLFSSGEWGVEARATFLRKTKEQIEAEKHLMATSIVENPHEREVRQDREQEQQSAAARSFNEQFGTKKSTELKSNVPLRWGDRYVLGLYRDVLY